MRRILLPFILLFSLLCAACQTITPHVEPAKGSVEGGDSVSIFAGPFRQGDNPLVTFGGKKVGTVSVTSEDEIQVTVPPGEAPGSVDVVLTDSHGKQVRIEKGFEYQPRKDTPTGTGGGK
jgi:IPT/TIG domain